MEKFEKVKSVEKFKKLWKSLKKISKKGDKEPDGGDGWEVSTPVDRIGSNTEREDTGSGSGGFLGNGEKDPNNSV